MSESGFGVPPPKPTRLLLKTDCTLPDFVYEGKPTFDQDGSYKGPLPPPLKGFT